MKKYRINNLDCASCATRIEEGIRQLEGVHFVSVNFSTASLTIDTNNIEPVKKKIKEIEPEAELGGLNFETKWVSTHEILENKKTLFQAAAGLILLIAGFLITERITIVYNIRLKDLVF